MQRRRGGRRSVTPCCAVVGRRGLDVAGHVDHVVNFDFPLNPVDYLHRTGRTARAGAPGNVVSLVDRRDQVPAPPRPAPPPPPLPACIAQYHRTWVCPQLC